MSTALADLKASLIIDKMALDDEVIRQPQLFFDIGEQMVEASAERDAAKEELASIDAELDGVWRSKLAKLGDRPTDAKVKNCVQSSSEHEKAFNNYLAAKTKAEKFIALRDAFQQRSSMLRDLVTLHATSYFQDSSMKPSKLQEASHYSAQRARLSEGRSKQK